MTMLDPLLVSSFLMQQQDDDETACHISELLAASQGVATWRKTLLKGRLPTADDFLSGTATNNNDDDGTSGSSCSCWPPAPLFDVLMTTMAELQFPRFVLRHPETVNSVLRTVLHIAIEFARRRKQTNGISALDDDDDDDDDDEEMELYVEDDDLPDDSLPDEVQQQLTADDETELSADELQQLAKDLVAEGISLQWGGVIGGVQSLDQLFGVDHGLLTVDDDNNNNNNMLGFGLQDEVWKRSGWKLLPLLQREIAAMPELRDLIHALGRRPTAEQSSNAIHKFVPRQLDNEGALGAQFDATHRMSIRGLTLSGSLSEMLPSEAMLLVKRNETTTKNNNTTATGTSSVLRRLFLAKMVEKKLLSYESSGWQDVPSRPIPLPRFRTRLPSAPGGPIMICLDTSWSMTGRREQLSKAVVLACVAAAHKQKRDIQVVAFSSQRNVMETGPITADAAGVQRLLDFLSSSFGGGTDVTGALKHVMKTISTTTVPVGSIDQQDGNIIKKRSEGRSSAEQVTKQGFANNRMRTNDINDMASADILLVTDGEIPDPPVSAKLMESLEILKQRAGVQVHGLLVGKRESVPLAKLCTHIHDFLIGYDAASVVDVASKRSVNLRATGAASVGYVGSKKTSFALRATGRATGPSLRGRSVLSSLALGRTSALHFRNGSINSEFPSLMAKFSGDDDDGEDWGGRRKLRKRDSGRTSFQPDETVERIDSFAANTQEALVTLEASVAETIRAQSWHAARLDDEKNSEHSCWRYRSELRKAVDRIAEGLVERNEEARLVVLGMVAQEHVLFLGPPGTAKSVLGRRLSQLCGGRFFQRLLTRFTTPEEIFGPLSLRALENDEYKRKTDGFLPTATVAFLDEIFKANSAILNTLLTVLNERQFDNGAGVREECPIRCVVGASNELPESDELDALYDRFLLRKEVLPVSDDGILEMLGMPSPGLSSCDGDSAEEPVICNTVFTDNLDELIKAISRAADAVVMDDEACFLMRDMRNVMRQDHDVEVSDRRLVKATRLLKVSAACHGRNKVDPLDCLLLQHLVWRLPEQRAAVREWLWSHVTPGSSGLTSATWRDESLESAASSSVQQFRLLIDGIRDEAIVAVRKTSGDVTGQSGGRPSDIETIRSLSGEASRIATILQQRADDLERHSALLRRAEDHLWLDPDEAQAAKQQLLPRSEAFLTANKHALVRARCLERALAENSFISNDSRLAVIEQLWDEEEESHAVTFSDEALNMHMREAKAKYDTETFRKWKRARKRVEG
jgi:MoxR-like ATPase